MILKKNAIITSISIGIFLLYILNNAYAQDTGTTNSEDPNWFLEKKISSFQYQGLKIISRSAMNNVLSDYIGKQFTYEILQEIQGILYELIYFRNNP